jgi:DNA-binding GntR family transcriptional regulator
MDAIAPSKSLVEKTYDALLDAICTGVLKPGDRLAQDELAEMLNVSRQPVNSAIAMLKTQRFVKDTGRRGVIVAPVDRRLFDSIYQFRAAVEPLAVQLATPRLGALQIIHGRAIVERGTALMQAGDAKGVLEADIEFHTLIYELSDNQIIIDTMRLNWQHLRRSMGEVLRFPGMTFQVWKEHRQIFETMVAGDAATAADLMRKHILDAPRRIAGQIEETGSP